MRDGDRAAWVARRLGEATGRVAMWGT